MSHPHLHVHHFDSGQCSPHGWRCGPPHPFCQTRRCSRRPCPPAPARRPPAPARRQGSCQAVAPGLAAAVAASLFCVASSLHRGCSAPAGPTQLRQWSSAYPVLQPKCTQPALPLWAHAGPCSAAAGDCCPALASLPAVQSLRCRKFCWRCSRSPKRCGVSAQLPTGNPTCAPLQQACRGLPAGSGMPPLASLHCLHSPPSGCPTDVSPRSPGEGRRAAAPELPPVLTISPVVGSFCTAAVRPTPEEPFPVVYTARGDRWAMYLISWDLATPGSPASRQGGAPRMECKSNPDTASWHAAETWTQACLTGQTW